MQKAIMRSSQRGRAGKIVKSSGPSAARNRLARGAGGGPGAGGVAAQNLTAHDGQAILDADADADAVSDVNYADLPLSNEQYAAAAAASAALQANIADQDVDKVEDEMVDDQNAIDPDLGQHPEHMDLNEAANILANGNAGGQDLGAMQSHLHHAHVNQHSPADLVGGSQQQQQLGHPGHVVDPTLGKTTDTMAIESGYVNLIVESQLAKRLASCVGLRLAQQRRPEQQINLQRRSNVEALFAHIAGKLAKVQCKNCHKGHGPWNSCVIVEGQMCGSCANCWFNASGARCSFHGMKKPTRENEPTANVRNRDPPEHNPRWVLFSWARR